MPNDGQTHPLLNALARQDIETGKTALYRFDDAVIPEEHVFVPKAGASDPASGWLIGTSLDTVRQATQVHVFDAEQIEDGPVASLRLPYSLPLGLHGRFVAG